MGRDFGTEFRNDPLAASRTESKLKQVRPSFACLEVFQQEDSEQAQLETEGTLRTIDCSMNPSLILTLNRRGKSPSHGYPIGCGTRYRLLLRIQDPLRNAYHYRPIDGSVDRTLYNLDREEQL